MLPWVCSGIDHRRRQNVVRTSVTHSAIASCATFLFIASCATFLFIPHFDVICDLLLNRRTATWNLFVNYNSVLLRARMIKYHSDIACLSQNALDCISAHIHFKKISGEKGRGMPPDPLWKLVAFGHSGPLPQTINPR